VTRRAVVTQAQIERGLRAAKAAMPDQPWRIRITPAEVTIEPSPLGLGHASGEQAEAAGTSPAVDESEDIVL
jgi:hypothetical protein